MISVVIPTFNRAPFLKVALQSILQQTLPPHEVIVVDDGSTDETKVLCHTEFPTVHYIYQENRGVAAARNLGIRQAKGEWVAFLDSDDAWTPKKLERQWDFVQKNPDAQIIQTEEIWIRKGVRVNPRPIHKKQSGEIFEYCVPLCIVSPSAVMIHKNVFKKSGPFDEDFLRCEDYEFWLRISLHYPIFTVPEALTIKKNGHEGQLSATPAQDRWRVKALLKILNDPHLTPAQTQLVKADIQRRAKILVQGCQKRDQKEEAEYFLSLTK